MSVRTRPCPGPANLATKLFEFSASAGHEHHYWLGQHVIPEFPDRVLPVDDNIVRRCTRLKAAVSLFVPVARRLLESIAEDAHAGWNDGDGDGVAEGLTTVVSHPRPILARACRA